ncbi:Mob1/phocein [Mycena vitilis]|nr:Mob1/phocein [Mycena vitilis]
MSWSGSQLTVFDFYTNLNEFYGVLTEFCTQHNCPTMSAGTTLNYTWINQDRKHVHHLPAPTYIDYVMTWVQNMLDDDNVFPTKSGQDFPPSFPSTVKHIYRQLLRVFAHIYYAHYGPRRRRRAVGALEGHGHLEWLMRHCIPSG